MKGTSIFLITGLMSIIFLSSCRESNKASKTAIEHEDHLIVELLVKVPEDDSFEVYYRTEHEQYASNNRVATKVKGSSALQKVEFVMDQSVFPTYIRLDLGINQKQGDILLDQIVFKYNDAEHVFDKKEIKKYFRPSKYLDFNFDTMMGRAKKVDNKFDPYLDSNNISKFVNELILY